MRRALLSGIHVVVYILLNSKLECIFYGISEFSRRAIAAQMMMSSAGLRKSQVREVGSL